MLRRLAALGVAMWACAASAQESCYSYQGSVSLAWGSVEGSGSSAESACSAAASSASGTSFSGYTYEIAFAEVTDEVPGAFTCRLTETWVNNSTSEPGGPGTRWFYGSKTPEDCPDDACAINAGETELASGDGDSAPRTICLGGCNATINGVSVSAGGKYSGYYKHSGTSCDTEEEATGQADGANCITTSSGRVCASKQDKNCGVFNGKTMCAASVPEGSCVLFEGGAICDGESSGGPKDSEGEPLTPDALVGSGGVGNPDGNYNYYNSSTVSSSSTTVVGSGSGADGGGSTGDGEGEGGVDECESEAECYGELPEEVASCSEDLLECVLGHAAGAWDTVTEGVPILAFASELHSAFGTTASCPEAPVTILGESHDVMASVCSLLNANSSLLELIFQVCWGILGVRILIVPDGEGA